jgi:Asp-tRNA(Asn)/Glu-tRNA(Gln) amidotransferase A subunit family amidase
MPDSSLPGFSRSISADVELAIVMQQLLEWTLDGRRFGSNAGIPGISIPAGLTRAGLPVGIELDGASGSDRSLLAVAGAIEQALGFSAAPPCVEPKRQ